MKTLLTMRTNKIVTCLTPAPNPWPLKMNPSTAIFTNLAVAAVFMASQRPLLAAGPAPVNLGSTAHFAILAGAAITTTGGGTITGDVGASPITGAAIHLTAAQVHGTIYAVDASGPAGSVMAPGPLLTAKGDLTKAYNDAAGRTPVPSGPFLNPGAGNIGGLNLVPGLYKFTSTAMITGANLTLTGGANDVWIFQIKSDLEVGSTIHVILAGGAQARNIFWQVGTSATIGTFAVFKGTILAAQAVTMNTSSTMDGRAMAFSAGVTFDGTSSGSLPMPEVPVITSISRANLKVPAIVLALKTTPYFQVTLQSSPDLSPSNWTTVATSTPVTSIWNFTDYTISASVTQRFYRAYITP